MEKQQDDNRRLFGAYQSRFTSYSQASETLSVQTSYRRSHSSTTSAAQNVPPISASLPKLDSNLLSSSNKTTSMRPRSSVDARPINTGRPTTINLNYQSPYRNAVQYRSFNSSRTTPPAPSYSVRSPPAVTIQSKPSASTEKPAKLVVKKTGKFYDDSASYIPTYPTHSKHRGEVLIINNIMFKGNEYRNGAQKDDEQLKDLFKQIGFNVSVARDLKAIDMINKVKKFSGKNVLKTADISVVVVMSHGTKSTSVGDTEVFGIDEKPVLVEDFLELFTEVKCKNMKGKPKIFIFQCCRGDNEQFIQRDARLAPKSPVVDALIAYSTLPGFVSYRDAQIGTFYINTLCEIFSQHAHEYHVEELLKIVDVKLSTVFSGSTKQSTSYESRGFKRCYLHPK